MQTTLTIHPQSLTYYLAIPFQAVAAFAESVSRAISAADYMEDYAMMSDADLADHGLSREEIKRTVFRILG